MPTTIRTLVDFKTVGVAGAAGFVVYDLADNSVLVTRAASVSGGTIAPVATGETLILGSFTGDPTATYAVKWDDGAGDVLYDVIAPAGSGAAFPSVAPDNWLHLAAFAADTRADGTCPQASTSTRLYFAAADAKANALSGTLATPEYVETISGTGLGQMVPIASVGGSSGAKYGDVLAGHAIAPTLGTDTLYRWTGIPAQVSATSADPMAQSGAIEPGETGYQTLREIRATLVGRIDRTSVAGYSVFYRKDGTTEAFRVANPTTSGRQGPTLGGGL